MIVMSMRTSTSNWIKCRWLEAVPLETSASHSLRGYNIGVRLIEDFLARTGQGKCKDLRDTADVLSKVSAVCSIIGPARKLIAPRSVSKYS